MSRALAAAVASGGGAAPAQVTATKNFSDAGSGGYLACLDTAIGQIVDGHSILLGFRRDVANVADENLVGKGAGTTNEWRVYTTSSGSVLRVQFDGFASINFDLDATDLGKMYWLFATCSVANGCQAYLFRATDKVAAFVGGVPNTSSSSRRRRTGWLSVRCARMAEMKPPGSRSPASQSARRTTRRRRPPRSWRRAPLPGVSLRR